MTSRKTEVLKQIYSIFYEEEEKMAMKGCLNVTKYFLFIFNLLFFILGGLLLCFGLWILFDRSSFASFIGASAPTLKVWSYVFSGIGILTMLLGFLGCLGSLKEIRCLLGIYFAFLLLLFAAQITVGVLVYTQRNSMGCCGWFAPEDWMKNQKISENSSVNLYPCSCRNTSSFLRSMNISSTANFTELAVPSNRFCTDPARDKWPVYQAGCMNVFLNNIVTIVGICIGIVLLELFVMTLSMCLCRNLDQNYNKLSRYS
ncbi:leukocyte antigen CD37-like isoform X3 [Pyxicephalus adspersus]|uniref:leukocyte antigen CD37-like isoform X3 n=1 Tax=Pyxicephalus adspersus TaxID=30357 RepID=UPI003B5C6020